MQAPYKIFRRTISSINIRACALGQLLSRHGPHFKQTHRRYQILLTRDPSRCNRVLHFHPTSRSLWKGIYRLWTYSIKWPWPQLQGWTITAKTILDRIHQVTLWCNLIKNWTQRGWARWRLKCINSNFTVGGPHNLDWRAPLMVKLPPLTRLIPLKTFLLALQCQEEKFTHQMGYRVITQRLLTARKWARRKTTIPISPWPKGLLTASIRSKIRLTRESSMW